jgi:hypothetical protein
MKIRLVEPTSVRITPETAEEKALLKAWYGASVWWLRFNDSDEDAGLFFMTHMQGHEFVDDEEE